MAKGGGGRAGGGRAKAEITKAYKYGVDAGGEIWVSGVDLQKGYDKFARLYQRHAKPGGATKWKQFAQERLRVLEKHQRTGRHELTSTEQQLLHRIARDILQARGRVG